MKNKIALFTWCYTAGAINYGQILQCYALQKYCKEQGYDVEVVKYRKIGYAEDFRLIPSKGRDRDRYEKEYKNKNYESQEREQAKRVNEFVNEYISFSRQCYSINDILEEIVDCDILLVGSDQLWNPLWIDWVYLLEFDDTSRKHISYSTSGICSDKKEYEKKIQRIAKGIERFEYVSVRETISKKILERYSDKNVFVALDPVFLLGKEEWEELIDVPIVDEPYVFAFYIGRIDPQKHLIHQVARKYGIQKIVYVKMEISDEVFNDLDIMVGIQNVGPKEFISLIRYAAAVCTDSFHAFAFSMIFHKEFYLMNRAYVHRDEASTSRWNELLESLGIGSRAANSRKEIMNLKEIDYESAENRLNTMIDESKSWLNNALQS